MHVTLLALVKLVNNPHITKSCHTMAATIFLMIVLAVSASTIGTTPRNIEATVLSDYCDRFGVLCEEETPPPAEGTPTTGGGTADFRAMFLTYIDHNAQRDLYNRKLDSGGDVVVMHLGLNEAPSTTDMNAMDQITSVPDSRKGLEFFSLAEIKKYAPLVAQRGWGFISYDLEGISPDAEEADPVRAVKQAKSYASAASIQLMVAPSQKIVSSHGAAFAQYVDRFHMQSQIHQDNDSTCTFMRDWINSRIASIEKAKPSLAGEITAQITMTNYAASGKTIYQTAEDCLDRPLTEGGGRADGMSIWFGRQQFDDGTYSRLLTYYENNYS